MYKVFGWDYVEPFVGELSVKNLSILEKEIPECKEYTLLKKPAATPGVVNHQVMPTPDVSKQSPAISDKKGKTIESHK